MKQKMSQILNILAPQLITMKAVQKRLNGTSYGISEAEQIIEAMA